MKLIAQLKEDLQAHGGDWTRPGFHAVAVHRLGRWARHQHWRRAKTPVRVLSKALFVFVRNFYGIELPFEAHVGRRTVFEHQHGIVVHGCSWIGDDCVIRQGVTLGMRYMDRPGEAPYLEGSVDVGAGAKILGFVHVGRGARVGANAVVLDDVPRGVSVVGTPARVVGGVSTFVNVFS
jgi:serine O-acetyltransferase